jgi:hypothetical protein
MAGPSGQIRCAGFSLEEMAAQSSQIQESVDKKQILQMLQNIRILRTTKPTIVVHTHARFLGGIHP